MLQSHRTALFLLVTLFMAGVMFAQTQITTAVIQGTVLDPSSAVIPGASVEAHNLDTGIRQSTATDENGRFSFLALTPGRYEVIAKKENFAVMVQQGIDLTVGEALNVRLTMKVSTAGETVTVAATTNIDVSATEASSTLNDMTVAQTPILGRKFEDLLTLTPGVSIVQGPDGDEINFAGQRGIFNNISLDGGDYNNGFFGEQVGGQRAAIDITLDAVKEFQVVATGASAEFGRTAGGVVNVITKSGTDQLHGTLFHYQRLGALSADTSDGKPLQNFHREQFGGTIGGPIIKQKMFYFGALEQILETLTRQNLGAALGSCSVTTPVVGINDAQIGSNPECQRLALLNFFKNGPLGLKDDESLPVLHDIHNTAALGKFDWNVNHSNTLSVSYNFDRSNNPNQTFDVPTYGTSANGIEGPSKINDINFNLFTTVSNKKVNEGHFSFSREGRPRNAVSSDVNPDTAMGFGPTFRFGHPFFLEPSIDETFKRFQVRDNFSIVTGNHTLKFGGEFLHSNNAQVFRGFFQGRYIFDSVVGFLHYASPAATGNGFGPTAAECANGSFVNQGQKCPDGFTATQGPLLLYLQDTGTGLTKLQPGASDINNKNYALFIQDKWQVRNNLTLNYGLRWEAQTFPDPVIPPAQTAYGQYLSNPLFPSTGKIPNATKMFQPRLGLAWDIHNNQKSLIRASYGIYNAFQNMLTQVGAITTNGVQQQEFFAGDVATCPLTPAPANGTCPGVPAAYQQVFISPNGPNGAPPIWPGLLPSANLAPGTFPFQPGVTVFDRHYANPRTYTGNFGYEQDLGRNVTGYLDLTLSHTVHLTRFVNPNVGSQVSVPLSGDTVNYSGPIPFPNLGSVTDTQSSAHSLYRGMTIGARKRFSNNFQLEANYVLSEDLDDDSNERDPFTFRYFNEFDFRKDYSFSDRDERHKFNLFGYMRLPYGLEFSPRIQAHTAQPITDNPLGTGTGPACSVNNSTTRVVNGVDCGRNHLRKDNGFFTFDWRATRPFHFGDRYALTPQVEMFNSFNNKNNINPLVTPGLFNFDGFLRQGVGDPLEVQLSLKFAF